MGRRACGDESGGNADAVDADADADADGVGSREDEAVEGDELDEDAQLLLAPHTGREEVALLPSICSTGDVELADSNGSSGG